MAELNPSPRISELVIGNSNTQPPSTHEGTGCVSPQLKPFKKNGELSFCTYRHQRMNYVSSEQNSASSCLLRKVVGGCPSVVLRSLRHSIATTYLESLSAQKILGFAKYKIASLFKALLGTCIPHRSARCCISHLSCIKVLIMHRFTLESTSLSVEQHDSPLHGRVSPSEETGTQPGTCIYHHNHYSCMLIYITICCAVIQYSSIQFGFCFV